MIAPRHAVLLLAAGGSRRLGQPKQLLAVAGEPLVRRAARAALATDPDQLLVVVGARAEDVWAAVADLSVKRVDCADWAAGLSASLQAGLRAVDAALDGVLIVLCDQPAAKADHLQELVAVWQRSPQQASASAYSGTLGVPAVLPSGWLKDLQTLHGDRGARDLLRKRQAEVLRVERPSLANDIDRPIDIDRASTRSSIKNQ